MKKFSIFFLILIAGTFIFAGVASAEFPNWGQEGLVTCSGLSIGEEGGCNSFCDILATGKNIIEFIVTIALFIAAPIFILVGGIMLVAGGANPGLHSKGVAYIKTTVIGIIIVLLSYAIVSTFIGALGIGGAIKGFGNPLECSSSLLSIKTAYADTLDVSIPGTTSSSNPIQMIAGFYSFALAISGILAVAVIMYGAIKYMSSPGSPGGQSEAREWITSALLGILLLAGAYLILNTINPDLTILRLPGIEKLNLVAPRSGPAPTSPGAGRGPYGFEGVAIPTGTYTDAEARAALAAAGISVNKSNCRAPEGQNTCNLNPLPTSCTDCTSLSAIPIKAIDELIQFKRNCEDRRTDGCTVIVTGGTEAGHSSHRIAISVLDISYRADTNAYVVGLLGEFTLQDVVPCRLHRGRDGNQYMLEDSRCPWKPAPHWHIVFD